MEKTIRKIVLRIPWHRLLSCSPWPLSYYRRTQVSVCCQCVMISAVILPQFGEGRFPTGVLQPNSQWLYNNYYELELIEPPNKDGYLGSFHEMLGNRVSLNTRKLQVWGEEVLESFFFYFIRSVHSRHYKDRENESTFYVKRDFFTQFLDRSNRENHWSNYTFDFRTTSSLFSLVRCIDLKVFRLSLINYYTFLFHSALVNH